MSEYAYLPHGQPMPEGYEEAGPLQDHHGHHARLIKNTKYPNIFSRPDGSAYMTMEINGKTEYCDLTQGRLWSLMEQIIEALKKR